MLKFMHSIMCVNHMHLCIHTHAHIKLLIVKVVVGDQLTCKNAVNCGGKMRKTTLAWACETPGIYPQGVISLIWTPYPTECQHISGHDLEIADDNHLHGREANNYMHTISCNMNNVVITNLFSVDTVQNHY